MNPWMKYVFVTVVAGLVLFTNLGTPRLWDRDEPRNAGCAAEMLARNDWVTPIFNDELRDQKPVLLYWFIMSAYSVFGVNEFAARFWSAGLAVGTVLLTTFMATRLFGQKAGLWAGLILCSTIMFNVAGHAATPDSVLIFFATATLAAFVYFTFPKNSEENPVPTRYELNSTPALLAFYSLMGLAVLAKGPVGVVVPLGIVLLFRWIMEFRANEEKVGSYSLRMRKVAILLQRFAPGFIFRLVWSQRVLVGALIVVAIAAPWFLWVGLRTEGDFLKGFFFREHLGRATTAMENHSGGLWFYPVAIIAGTFPWSILLLPFVWDLVKSLRTPNALPARERAGMLLAMTWILVVVGLFSIAKTKLPSYVTPCYPAIALLAGRFVAAMLESRALFPRIQWLAVAATLGLIGVGIGVTLPILAKQFAPGLEVLGLAGGILVMGSLSLGYFYRKGNVPGLVYSVGITSVVFCFGVFGFGMVAVDRLQERHQVLSFVREVPTGEFVATYGELESSWVFDSRHTLYEISREEKQDHQASEATSVRIENGESLDGGDPLKIDSRTKRWKPKPRPELQSFVENPKSRYLITTQKHVSSIAPEMLAKMKEVARAKYFLEKDELILLEIDQKIDMANQPSTKSPR